MTRYYGKAQAAADRIVAAFRAGKIPEALAQVFVHRADDVPCRSWSVLNQLIVALAGSSDARGFRQWQAVGRYVNKGERSIHILVPLCRKAEDPETGEERVHLYGFKGAPVFGFEQTGGAPLPVDHAAQRFLDSLPLVTVARSWGLSVESYNGQAGRAFGKYRRGQGIALGVENLSTWAHELIHAADDRLGNLKEFGQHWRSETVAELGGAVLLGCIGRSVEADLGGCWRYVKAYADKADLQPVTACRRVVERVCAAVNLVLDEADVLTGAANPPAAVA